MRRLILIISIFLALTTLLVRCTQKSGHYLNTDPAVKYTGTLSCEPCHKKIYQTFIETGMGKSLYRPDREKVIERFGPSETVHDPERNFSYFAFWQGEDMMVKEFRVRENDTVYQRVEKVDYVVGSGHQTRSYLLQRNGYLYEIPITWYVSKGIWDLSPGYDVVNSRFSREIGMECMACHTGYFELIEGSKNRYRMISEGIDCEKCHGPGEEHIRLIEGGQLIDVGEEIDYSIVNPSKLPINEQFDVCQQCHLQGVNVMREAANVLDFRPSTALKESWDVFIERHQDENAFGIASHAERLQQSRCFIASAGTLTCTTCHDPHKSVKGISTEIFTQQCTQCHTRMKVADCGETETMRLDHGNDCISCHMPGGGTSDIPHVSFHDHKIRVVNAIADTNLTASKEWLKLACATRDTVEDAIWSEAWLLYFERQDSRAEYLELASDNSANLPAYEKARLAFYQNRLEDAAKQVQTALAENQGDYLLHFLKGEIHEAGGEFAAAAAAYQQSYRLNPEGIEAGMKWGVNELRTRRGEREVLTEAKALFEALLREKAFDERLHANLGFVMMNLGELEKAEYHFSRALQYDPDYQLALENMIMLQNMKGNPVLAKKYLDDLSVLAPDSPAVIQLRKLIGD